MPRLLATWCQGGTLRALISALVLVQCALILLYWDATRGGGGGSGTGGGGGSAHPLRLQDKASHLHAQMQGQLLVAARRRFRESYDDVKPTGKPSSGAGSNSADRKWLHGDGEPKMKIAGKEDGRKELGPEVTKRGELISPETELLLFKPSGWRKYKPDVESKEAEQSRPVGEGHPVMGQRDTGYADRTSITPEVRSEPQAKVDSMQDAKGLSGGSTQQQQTQSGAEVGAAGRHSTDSNHGRGSVMSAPAHTVHGISEQGAGTRTWTMTLQPEVQHHHGGNNNMRTMHLSQPTMVTTGETQSSAGGMPPTKTPQQGDLAKAMPQNIPLLQELNQKHSINLSTTRTDLLHGVENAESKVKFAVPVTTNVLGFEAQSTPKPLLAAQIEPTRIYPTYDHPMPVDPYSPNTSKLIFTLGTHGEFHRLTPDLPELVHLPPGDDVFLRYFEKNGGEQCFKDGTATTDTANGESKDAEALARHQGCLCKRGWHGRHCSIPEGVFSSTGARFVDLLKPRNTSRRIISALAFNVEFELLEARLHELNDVVDVFIILESNSTNYGDPKPLLLLQRFRDGYLQEFHHKIIYLFRGEIPQGGREDGWLVDQHMRMFIGQEGMSRVFNSTPDDIFLYTDADELPNREAILFLRLHDGFSEPIGVTLRWSVFGFFWKQFDATRVVIGCTVGMFRYVFNNDAYQLRSTDYQVTASSRLHAYVMSGAFIYDWYMGDNGALAGWHCSWCLPPERIRVKLTSAINADFPRWGDFPEKLELAYLRSLVKTGTWFDDKSRFGMLANWQAEERFAPDFILKHYMRYKYLLELDET